MRRTRVCCVVLRARAQGRHAVWRTSVLHWAGRCFHWHWHDTEQRVQAGHTCKVIGIRFVHELSVQLCNTPHAGGNTALRSAEYIHPLRSGHGPAAWMRANLPPTSSLGPDSALAVRAAAKATWAVLPYDARAPAPRLVGAAR